LRENSTRKTPKISTVLSTNRRPSFELITVRINYGTYKNPSLKPSNRNNLEGEGGWVRVRV
jgi:hypothetical protein